MPARRSLAVVFGLLCCACLAEGAANSSSAALCSTAKSVCECSALAPGCGWCSSDNTCAPASECTTTCRECPSTHKTCRKSCRRNCIDTCSLVTSVCGCVELDGCGWCSHGKQCTPYPDCSTTCEECDPTCHNYKHCKAKCYQRFRANLKPKEGEGGSMFSHKDWVCAFGIFLATVLASAAGIGGGAVLVPLFTMLGDFTEHEAIPLSIATVFGASAFSTFGNFLWLKHPLVPHRHMIAYDVVTLLTPATLLGATAGVFLNKLCPNWLIMGLLVFLCGFSGKRTLEQAFKRREKENREMMGQYSAVSTTSNVEMTAAKSTEIDDNNDLRSEVLREEAAREAEFPWGTIGGLMRTWFIVLGMALLKGGHGAPSLVGVTCGSLGYWGVVLLNVPVLGAITYFSGQALTSEHKKKEALGYNYVEGDVLWDETKATKYPLIVTAGAVAAGLLGVGGGMILGPIFNELGFLPQVSSATSTLMVLFMSSATVGQFVVFGMLDMKYALFFMGAGVIGAIVGTKGAKVLIDRSGRASFIVFFLAFILLGSGVLMFASGAPQILETGFTGFRPLCGRAGAAERFD